MGTVATANERFAPRAQLWHNVQSAKFNSDTGLGMNFPLLRRGFTLIELVIAVLLIAILAAVAYPTYQHSIIKSRRTEAKTALLDLQNRLERYYLDHSTYVTATIGQNNPATDILSENTTPNKYYRLEFGDRNDSPPRFAIKAIPLPPQDRDLECATFTLNNQGERGFTGTGSNTDCW